MVARRTRQDEAYVALIQQRERIKIEVSMSARRAFKHVHIGKIKYTCHMCIHLLICVQSRSYTCPQSQAKLPGTLAASEALTQQIDQKKQERQQREDEVTQTHAQTLTMILALIYTHAVICRVNVPCWRERRRRISLTLHSENIR